MLCSKSIICMSFFIPNKKDAVLGFHLSTLCPRWTPFATKCLIRNIFYEKVFTFEEILLARGRASMCLFWGGPLGAFPPTTIAPSRHRRAGSAAPPPRGAGAPPHGGHPTGLHVPMPTGTGHTAASSGKIGVEPITSGFEDHCSTIELLALACGRPRTRRRSTRPPASCPSACKGAPIMKLF